MKFIVKYGTILFDFIVITLLLTIGCILILPFIPIYIGVIGYFLEEKEERGLLDIFYTIQNNFKMILKLSGLLLVIIVFSVLNIAFLQTDQTIQIIMTSLSWIMLVIALILLTFGPMILLKMNVTLKQLIFNSVILIFGKLWFSIVLALLWGIFLYLCAKTPFAYLIGIGFLTWSIARLTELNLNVLKEKGEKTA